MEDIKTLCSNINTAINENSNLTEEFKNNLCTLFDLVVATLGVYDYSYFCEILKTIKIEDDNKIEEYTEYIQAENILKMNKSKMLDDNIDVRNIFLQQLLLICTHKEV